MRRIRRILLVFVLALARVKSKTPFFFSSTSDYDDKRNATKTDPSCQSFENRTNVIFEDNVPCRNTSATGNEVGMELGTNNIYFNTFVAIPPQRQSLGFVLKIAVTTYLNITSREYDYHISYPGQVLQSYHENILETVWQWIWSKFGNLEEKVSKKVDLYLVYYEPEVILKEENQWWWKYRFNYKCYHHNANNTLLHREPILDPDFLQEIRQKTAYLLSLAMQFDRYQNELFDLIPKYQVFRIQFTDPREETTDEDVAGTIERTPPTLDLDDDDAGRDEFEAFDASEWDWRRYLGVALLVGTVAGTATCVMVANKRRQKRTKNELWGNLATEEGVSKLLGTSWKVKDGKLLVYDKTGYGYTDDDSILMGGFEQSELVGTEVSLKSTCNTSHDERLRSSIRRSLSARST